MNTSLIWFKLLQSCSFIMLFSISVKTQVPQCTIYGYRGNTEWVVMGFKIRQSKYI